MGFAWLVSLGHLSRVFANYVHAVRFWVRHRRSFGSHPILDSRIYGGPRAAFSHQPKEPGFLGHGLGAQLLRLFGENPLLLALPFAPIPQEAWALRLYVWGVSLSALSVISTIVWPLRAFGPGRGYMKAAIFPTAYVLAAATSTPSGFLRLHALATLAAWAASVASIVFFLTYMRNKDNELTAHVPPGLKAMAAELALRKTGGVVCLPGGYSDYIAYNTGRAVLWGSHSGSLNKFELVAPLWQERVEHAARRHGVRYLIVERAFVDPAILALDPGCALVSTSPGFDLYDLQASPAPAAS